MQIIIRRSDGGVTIGPAINDIAPETIVARIADDPTWSARGWSVVSWRTSETPVAIPPDRQFRAAWTDELAGDQIDEDPERARNIHAERIRVAKREMLRELRDREDDGEDVTGERQALRAVDADAEVAGKGPDELRAHWPAAVERRGAPRE